MESRARAAKPGAAIKQVRRSRGLTLAQIGRATGISLSTLSKIENDSTSPSYDQLVRLSEGLQVDISAIFAFMQDPRPEAKGGRRSLNRIGEGQRIETANDSMLYLSSELRRKLFTPILSEVKATSVEQYGPFLHHDGEEFIFVVSGTLELHTEAYQPVLLSAGESVYFDSNAGHAYVRHGEEPCVILSICCSPHSYSEIDPPLSALPRAKADVGRRRRGARAQRQPGDV